MKKRRALPVLSHLQVGAFTPQDPPSLTNDFFFQYYYELTNLDLSGVCQGRAWQLISLLSQICFPSTSHGILVDFGGFPAVRCEEGSQALLK